MAPTTHATGIAAEALNTHQLTYSEESFIPSYPNFTAVQTSGDQPTMVFQAWLKEMRLFLTIDAPCCLKTHVVLRHGLSHSAAWAELCLGATFLFGGFGHPKPMHGCACVKCQANYCMITLIDLLNVSLCLVHQNCIRLLLTVQQTNNGSMKLTRWPK